MGNKKLFNILKKNISFLFIFFILFFTYPACSKKKIPLLRIGHALHDHHAALFIIASQPEYFKKRLDLYLETIENQKSYYLVKKGRRIAGITYTASTGAGVLVRKLHEQHFDMIMGGVAAMLSYIDLGSPIKIIAPAMGEGAGFLVSKSLPVKNWQSFSRYIKRSKRPLRIGFKAKWSVHNIIFEDALTASKINYSKNLNDTNVQLYLLNLNGGENLIPALESGNIDGFVVNQPLLAEASHRGNGKIITFFKDIPPRGKWLDHPCCAIAAREEALRHHSPLIEDLLVLIFTAVDFLNERPLEAQLIVAKWLGLDPEIEKLSMPTIKYMNKITPSWQNNMDIWLDSMIQNGKLTKKLKTAKEKNTAHKLIFDFTVYKRVKARINR